MVIRSLDLHNPIAFRSLDLHLSQPIRSNVLQFVPSIYATRPIDLHKKLVPSDCDLFPRFTQCNPKERVV